MRNAGLLAAPISCEPGNSAAYPANIHYDFFSRCTILGGPLIRGTAEGLGLVDDKI